MTFSRSGWSVLVVLFVAAAVVSGANMRTEEGWTVKLKKFITLGTVWDHYRDQEYFGLYHTPGFKSFAKFDADIAADNADGLLRSQHAISESNDHYVRGILDIKSHLTSLKDEVSLSMIKALHAGVPIGEFGDVLNEDVQRSMKELLSPDAKEILDGKDASCEEAGSDAHKDKCLEIYERLWLSCLAVNSIMGLSTAKLKGLFENLMKKMVCSEDAECRFVSREPPAVAKQMSSYFDVSEDILNGGFLKTWNDYRKLLKYPTDKSVIKEHVESGEPPALKDHIDLMENNARETFHRNWDEKVAAIKEKAINSGMSEEEIKYRAACSPPSDVENPPQDEDFLVDWNICREKLYLQKGVMNNEEMGVILDFRSKVTERLLEVAGAESHDLAMKDAIEYTVNGRHGNGLDMATKMFTTLFQAHLDFATMGTILEALKTNKDDIKSLMDGAVEHIKYDFDPFVDGVYTPAPRVTFPNMGSMSPTSDIDIPVTGLYAEHVVVSFYNKFRTRYRVESSTAMDVNAYGVGSDLVIKLAEKRVTSRDVGTPIWSLSDLHTMFRAQRPLVQSYYENGDIASLLGIRRSMHDEKDWTRFAGKVTKYMARYLLTFKEEDVGVGKGCEKLSCHCGGHALVAEFARRNNVMLKMFDRLEKEKLARMKTVCPGMERHDMPADCVNRAMNELYAEKLQDILPQRMVFEQFVDQDLMAIDPSVPNEDFNVERAADAVLRADRLTVIMSNQFMEAGFFGNEAYVGAGGAILHVVGNMQGGRGIMMTADHALQSVNENYGMLLHAFEHFGEAEPGGLKFGRSLFQTGKYLIRIVNAYRYIEKSAQDGDRSQLIIRADLKDVLNELEVLGNALNKVKGMKMDNDDGVASVLVRKTAYTLKMVQRFMHNVYGLIEHTHDDATIFRESDSVTPEEIGMKVFLSMVESIVAEINAVARLAGVGVPLLDNDVAAVFGFSIQEFLEHANDRFAKMLYDKEEIKKGDRKNAVLSLRQRLSRKIEAVCRERDDSSGVCAHEFKVGGRGSRKTIVFMPPLSRDAGPPHEDFLTGLKHIAFADADECIKDKNFSPKDRSYFADARKAFEEMKQELEDAPKGFELVDTNVGACEIVVD